MRGSLLERFLRYVRIDTQSDPASRRSPSTERQETLLRELRRELEELGAGDVRLDPHGYLFATVPATSCKEGVPTVAFLAHVDTAPDFSGTAVEPLVHRDYRGQRLVLPDDPSQILDPADPRQRDLESALRKDLITASGRTLLGADDKAGVAIVVSLADALLCDPDIPHGRIRLCFTPDEEVGRGVDRLALEELGARVAYTVDGEGVGEVNAETFSAEEAVVTIDGVATHPGSARRHGMVNAVHLAAKFLCSLPRERASPEATDGREGFLHPTAVEGDAARATVCLILRDHDEEELAAKRRLVRSLCRALQAAYPTARVRCRQRRQYSNMGRWLGQAALPVELALEANRRAGLCPSCPPIRGGTDGARLTERGLPTPNLSCGAHNPHGPLEWVTRQDMEKCLEVLIELVRLWEERGDEFDGHPAAG
jgi:tripeptide aminopeptidase